MESLVIDLNRPEHRRRIAFVLAMTFINSIILNAVYFRLSRLAAASNPARAPSMVESSTQ